MMSPDLSHSNGTLSIPPPTGDSTASSGGGRTKDGQLPSIAGNSSKSRTQVHSKQPDGEQSQTLPSMQTLPSIGGHGGQSDGSDTEYGNNLPPIGVGKMTVRKVTGGHSSYGHSGNHSTHANVSHPSGRGKQQRGVANKHRSGPSNIGKYKKYGQ